MVKIYRGDDLGGKLGKRIRVKLESDLDINGCTAVVEFQKIIRSFSDIRQDQWLDIFYSHNETRGMSLGVGKMRIYCIDDAGKVRTVKDDIEIEVTDNLADVYGSDEEITVNVVTQIPWEHISGKPFEGRTVQLKTDDDLYAAVAALIQSLGGNYDA